MPAARSVMVTLYRFKIKIRRDFRLPVRPESERIEGKTYLFRYGFSFDDDETYPGEVAWQPWDPAYPYGDAPETIASGDLEFVEQVSVPELYPNGKAPYQMAP